MNQKMKQKWLTALRSGDYPQGKGMLRQRIEDTDHYCCLGVLCTLCPDVVWTPDEDHLPGAQRAQYKGEIGISYLPRVMMKELGLIRIDMVDLAQMNDTGKSFVEIAKVIDEKL